MLKLLKCFPPTYYVYSLVTGKAEQEIWIDIFVHVHASYTFSVFCRLQSYRNASFSFCELMGMDIISLKLDLNYSLIDIFYD